MDFHIFKVIWQMRVHDSMLRWYGVPYSSAVKLPAKKLLSGKERTKSQYFESVFL